MGRYVHRDDANTSCTFVRPHDRRLDGRGIAFVPPDAGLFVLLDLRRFLAERTVSNASSRAEESDRLERRARCSVHTHRAYSRDRNGALDCDNDRSRFP